MHSSVSVLKSWLKAKHFEIGFLILSLNWGISNLSLPWGTGVSAIGTGVRIFLGGSRNVYFSIFWLANPFSTYLNTINLSIFHNHGGIYRFVTKQNLWRDESAMGSIEILGSLYIKPGMKTDRYETEKSHRLVVKFI